MKNLKITTLIVAGVLSCAPILKGQQRTSRTTQLGVVREYNNGPKSIQEVSKTFNNPLGRGADPFIIKHNGLYYSVHNSRGGFRVTESRFLTRPERTAQVWFSPSSGPTAHQHWAPEIHPINGKWYIYAAGSDLNNGIYSNQRTFVLEGETPLGPYTNKGLVYTGDDPNQENGNRWAIDMTILEHEGKLYSIWSGWQNEHGHHNVGQLLYIAEMENPWTVKGTRKVLALPELSWEKGDHIALLEGPQVLKHGKDVFVFYSTRGSWTIHYKMGQLKLKRGGDPLDRNAWVKSPQPVFKGTDTVYGVGHASITTSPDDKEYWIYYHSKGAPDGGWSNRMVFMQKFGFDKSGNPVFGEPKGRGPMKRPSGEYEIERRDFMKKKQGGIIRASLPVR